MALAPTARHVHLVLNPISGRRRSRAVARRVIDAIASRAATFQFTETKGPGDARLAACRACASQCDVLVVVGGDGTVREAGEGMAGAGVPILIVPAGTENVLAKYLGLRLGPAAALGAMDLMNTITLDVAHLADRMFLFVAGVGFDAEAVRRLHRVRVGHIGYQHYIGPLMGALWRYQPPMMQVDVDGRRFFEGQGQLLVGNIPRYALGLRILQDAQPDDGRLDVSVLAYSARTGLLWHAAKVVCRRHVGSGGVHYWQGRCVRVVTESPAPVQVDGDMAGETPAVFELRDRTIRLVTGPGFRR